MKSQEEEFWNVTNIVTWCDPCGERLDHLELLDFLVCGSRKSVAFIRRLSFVLVYVGGNEFVIFFIVDAVVV